jgi:type IV secretory pathway VirB3-like protein
MAMMLILDIYEKVGNWVYLCICVFVHLYLQVVLAMQLREAMTNIWSTNWKRSAN